MANPPFNLKKYAEYGEFETDPRWKGYGVPPASNANYAWILHILNKLDVNHGIAGFLLANGALDDSDTLEIRKQLIENDKIEAIIVLPRNMFYSTDISVTLWILNNNKKGGPWHGRQLRNRTGEILFIDLRTWNSNIYEKKYVRLTETEISGFAKSISIGRLKISPSMPSLSYTMPLIVTKSNRKDIRLYPPDISSLSTAIRKLIINRPSPK